MKTLKIETITLIFMFFVTIAILLPLGMAAAENNVIEVTVQFPEPVITEVDGYSHVEMEGLYSIADTGEPVLPVKGINVLIPAGKDIKDSDVIFGEKVTLPGKYNIEPAQQPVPLSYAGKIERTLPKDEIYKSNNPFPKEAKKHITTQRMRCYRIATFTVEPMEYIPLDGTLSYYKSITLRINLESRKKAAQGKTKLRKSPKDKKRLEKFIVNPQDISGYDTLGDGEIQPLSDIVVSGAAGMTTLVNPDESYQYVVITNENLKNAPGPYNFQALCAEKDARGITTNIVTTEWIYANYDGTRPSGGTDNATKIRNFIIDAYNNWETEYILLGGDATGNPSGTEIIPVRKLFDEPWNGSGYATTIPSDLYYACLDGTMDYDADGTYGEKTDGTDGGEIDLRAEVYIGRAPVVTQEELSNFVRKTLTYKNTDSGYRLNTYMAGEYLGFGGVSEYATASLEEIRLGSGNYGCVTKGFNTFPSLELNTIYDAPGYSWPASNIVSIINNGVHVINHFGHSYTDFNMKLYIPSVDSLTNTDYFFGYSQGCYPGAFDQDSIVEHFVKNPTGAFAFIANSRYGWGKLYSTQGASQYYNREFWDAVFGEYKYNLGKANEDSKEDNLWCVSMSCHRWCYIELNLFGDPELSLKLIFSEGLITFDREKYSTSAQAGIRLFDSDLNCDPFAEDTVTVYVRSAAEVTPEPVILVEVDPDSSIFEGAIQVQSGIPQPDGIIQVNASDMLTVTYNDASPAAPKDAFAIIDSTPPVITGVASLPFCELYGGAGSTFSWQTDKPSTSTIYYGATPSLGSYYRDTNYTINHEVKISYMFNVNTNYYFAVESEDEVGNVAYDDNRGDYYQFMIVPPDIEVAPASLTFEVPEYSAAFDVVLNIKNSGVEESLPLIFALDRPTLYPSWLSPSPTDGTLSRGGSMDMHFTIDPSQLSARTYTWSIVLYTNIPSKIQLTIPLALTLTPLPPPVADFTAAPTEGEIPLTVQFTDTSTGAIAKRFWGFGDGSVSEEQNPVHTYNNAGTYTVRLDVNGPAGSNLSDRKEVIDCITAVFSGRIIDVQASKQIIMQGELLTLRGEITPGYFDRYDWQCDDRIFESGATNDMQQFIETTVAIPSCPYPFFGPGAHNVRLIMTNDDLGITVVSDPITITVARKGSDIQAAIDYASPGDTIELPGGVYILTSDLNITKNIKLVCPDSVPTTLNATLILGPYRILVRDPSTYDKNEYYYALLQNLTDVTIDRFTITGYTGISKEGAIQNYSKKLTLKNCRVVENQGVKVGAIYSCWGSQLVLDNTLVAKNTNLLCTAQYPGIDYGFSYAGYCWCGTIYLNGYASLIATNSTIADNINSSDPAKVKYGAIYRDYVNSLNIVNSIVWNNGIDFMHRKIQQMEGSVSITYSDTQSTSIFETVKLYTEAYKNNYPPGVAVMGVYDPVPYVLDSTHNDINLNPQFIAPDDLNYNIGPLSPCKGAGQGVTDIGAKF